MNDSDITIRKDLKIAVISMLKNLQKTGICWGIPNGSEVNNLLAVLETQETWIWSLSQDDSLEKEMVITPVFLPEKSHRQRSLVGHSS